MKVDRFSLISGGQERAEIYGPEQRVMTSRSRLGKRQNETGASRRRPRPDSGRQRWPVVIGIILCIGIVAFAAGKLFWRAGKTTQEREHAELQQQESPRESEKRPAAPLPLQGEAASPPPATSPPEPTAVPSRFSTLSGEPSAIPAEAEAPPPGPAASLQWTEEGLQQEAVDAVSGLIEAFPDDPDPIGLLGNLYVALGKTAEAVTCWEKCIELDPTRVDGYRGISDVALRKGEFASAEALSRKMLEIDATAGGVHAQLARALIGLGKPKEAIVALEKEIRISPEESTNYCELGRAYQRLDEFRKAAENYARALQIDPGYTEACYGLAVACARLGQKDEATKYREKFRELKARDWETLPNRAEAALQLKLLIPLRRDVAQTHTNVGLFYGDRGNSRQAEEHWLRAAVLDPTNTLCRHQLASWYQSTNRNREALQLCEQLRAIDPANAVYHLHAGILNARLTRFDAALAAVKRAIQLDPDNVEYRRTYAWIQREK